MPVLQLLELKFTEVALLTLASVGIALHCWLPTSLPGGVGHNWAHKRHTVQPGLQSALFRQPHQKQ